MEGVRETEKIGEKWRKCERETEERQDGKRPQYTQKEYKDDIFLSCDLPIFFLCTCCCPGCPYCSFFLSTAEGWED